MIGITHQGHSQLGIEVLDHDHDELEGYLAALGSALEKKTYNAASVETAFNELIDHIKDHFKREEAWLRKENYPGLKTHIRQHKQLVESVQAFCDQFIANPSKDSGRQVFGYVREWLVDHTKSADRVIGGYLGYKRKIS